MKKLIFKNENGAVLNINSSMTINELMKLGVVEIKLTPVEDPCPKPKKKAASRKKRLVKKG